MGGTNGSFTCRTRASEGKRAPGTFEPITSRCYGFEQSNRLFVEAVLRLDPLFLDSVNFRKMGSVEEACDSPYSCFSLFALGCHQNLLAWSDAPSRHTFSRFTFLLFRPVPRTLIDQQRKHYGTYYVRRRSVFCRRLLAPAASPLPITGVHVQRIVVNKNYCRADAVPHLKKPPSKYEAVDLKKFILTST